MEPIKNLTTAVNVFNKNAGIVSNITGQTTSDIPLEVLKGITNSVANASEESTSIPSGTTTNQLIINTLLPSTDSSEDVGPVPMTVLRGFPSHDLVSVALNSSQDSAGQLVNKLV